MKREKRFIIYGIGLLVLTLVGISLAYFTSNITSNDREVTISTGDLTILFTAGDSINEDNIEPGWSTSKTFSVENKSNSEYKYNIVIEDLINTFKSTGYLVYKITSTDGGYNMSEYEDVSKSSEETDEILAYSVSINGKSIHNYTIEIKYINDEDASQNIDMNSTLSGNIYITKYTLPTLAEAILRDNPIVSERTDFSVTNTSDTTGTIYKTTSTEDGSEVYYYSGNTTNNWVKFGGFYWRIIRTNEDGSVRLLYAGTSHDTTEGYINSSTAFNSINGLSRYVGYMYGETSSLADNRNNTTSSTIKGVIDTWYQNNLLSNYDKYISKSAIYCNDRSVGSGTWSNTGSSEFKFGAYTRLYTNKTPTYICGGNTSGGLFESTQATEDKFSASTTAGGNGQLTYPIALMTADEISFAGGIGGKFVSNLASPYAYYYTNSAGASITGSTNWWLLSPVLWRSPFSYVYYVFGSDDPGLLDYSGVGNSIGVRPVLSIDKCAKVTGTGTPEDPYVIDEANSTC